MDRTGQRRWRSRPVLTAVAVNDPGQMGYNCKFVDKSICYSVPIRLGEEDKGCNGRLILSTPLKDR